MIKLIKKYINKNIMKDNNSNINTLQSINDRLDYIEHLLIEERDALVDLTQQSNQLCDAIRRMYDCFEIMMSTIENSVILSNPEKNIEENLQERVYINNNRRPLNNFIFIEELDNRIKQFQKIEKELEKYKDDITPGTVGES